MFPIAIKLINPVTFNINEQCLPNTGIYNKVIFKDMFYQLPNIFIKLNIFLSLIRAFSIV